jgi:hypothetical protein
MGELRVLAFAEGELRGSGQGDIKLAMQWELRAPR